MDGGTHAARARRAFGGWFVSGMGRAARGKCSSCPPAVYSVGRTNTDESERTKVDIKSIKKLYLFFITLPVYWQCYFYYMHMTKLMSLPQTERPREKMMKYGPEKLSNTELLALLLRTGTKTQNVLDLSKSVLSKFSKNTLATASVEELSEVFGLGSAKACEIVACFELGKRLLKEKKATLMLSPQEVWKELKDIWDHKKEHHIVFYLDSRRQEIKREILAVGTLNTNLVHPRETFESAILHHAAQIIIAHNHPSGDPEPSDEDVQVTHRIASAGLLLGIELLDHVIVARERFVSMREKGLI